MPSRRLAFAAPLLAASFLLVSCADMPNKPQAQVADSADYESNNDPFESVNRVIFDVNDFLDRLLFKPIAGLYRATVPPPVRDRIADIVSNMGEPVTFANNLLQGEFNRAGVTLERFAINTTVGVGGSFEVANEWKLYKQVGDFGQTLYVWGIGDTPYLVLPLLGPSNIRDAIGMGVDSAMSPWQYLARIRSRGTRDKLDISYFGADGITRREQNIEGLDALRAGSLDFYAQMRSVMRQYRNKQLGIKGSEQQMPKFEDYE